MARHFIEARNAVEPGVIRSECSCGAMFQGPPQETDGAVMAHLAVSSAPAPPDAAPSGGLTDWDH